jgi:hypothetical protein
MTLLSVYVFKLHVWKAVRFASCIQGLLWLAWKLKGIKWLVLPLSWSWCWSTVVAPYCRLNVRVHRFFQLGYPNPLVAAKSNSRLQSFGKKLCDHKFNMSIKTCRILWWFEYPGKVFQKHSSKVVIEKVMEKWSILLL